ncbi:hypothetical protein KUTeg_022920 [Tegillarca granosa]|uniref:C1q domain-containing protein n=1 Tax=Tegillarca granosa TaxID=220873 RepID=A0ABQ9E5T0_TEGGR|nr:hypothetical protein KUTeg_022920 [Tegillarca granosa]
MSTSQINVAFHAWLSNGDESHITTNIGNGYSVKSGKFVAPVSGIYLFAVTVMGKSGCAEHLDIFKNNNRVGMVKTEKTKDLDSGSNVIVLDLTTSDVVYLKYFQNGACQGLFTYKDYAYNTFSGFLIKKYKIMKLAHKTTNRNQGTYCDNPSLLNYAKINYKSQHHYITFKPYFVKC